MSNREHDTPCHPRSEATPEGQTAFCLLPSDNYGDATCRAKCAACCIAISISPSMPALPEGKPAGVPCVHLDADLKCRLFHSPERPRVCGSLKPCAEMCGNSREEALNYLENLEKLTSPCDARKL